MPVLLTAEDPVQSQRWNDLVDASPAPDLYYRPGYTRAYQVEGEGKAVALHVEAGDTAFLFPLLLRPLSKLPFAPGTAGQDAITPYGYGGILPLRSAHATPDQLRAGLTTLADWCKSNDVVSILLRLHPLLAQDEEFETVVGPELILHPFGPTTAVVLAEWSEESLRKDRRWNLAVARRALRTTWSAAVAPSPPAPSLPEALSLFRGLYEATMDRLGAATFYHFSPAYYQALADGVGDRMAVALAWSGDQAVAGSIFFADRRYAHYHLSATNDVGRKSKATTLLIREAIDWARARGCLRLHLGGGVRGDDSLFDFKKGFGGAVHQYCFAGLICDPVRYQGLVAARLAQGGAPPRQDYFPAYRA
ncbi:MAG TPA: GNAT family N-acetyltransferase [Terriglobales bacterium]|nr:GNAT family N-acetyltransferase [Terriglobales bacterium]